MMNSIYLCMDIRNKHVSILVADLDQLTKSVFHLNWELQSNPDPFLLSKWDYTFSYLLFFRN